VITNFVESACWPDDVKTHRLTIMDQWHYIDLPVRYENKLKQAISYKPDDALGTIVRKFHNKFK
jgi:hypothetical protein